MAKANEINILNKRARYEYEILDQFEAGMALTGTEIKSLRAGNASITEAYCVLEGGELFLVNAHISVFKQGTHYNHEPLRKRKLLLHKKELRKIEGKLKDKGITVIPLKILENERGYAKLQIALARGKKAFDKREDIKKKDIAREMSRYD